MAASLDSRLRGNDGKGNVCTLLPTYAGMTGRGGRDEVGSDVFVHCRGLWCPYLVIPGDDPGSIERS